MEFNLRGDLDGATEEVADFIKMAQKIKQNSGILDNMKLLIPWLCVQQNKVIIDKLNQLIIAVDKKNELI